jgi:hypothetical protein
MDCSSLDNENCFSCSDGETFISADDLRINLWNLEINNQSFNIVDVKPPNMEDLTGIFALFFCKTDFIDIVWKYLLCFLEKVKINKEMCRIYLPPFFILP